MSFSPPMETARSPLHRAKISVLIRWVQTFGFTEEATVKSPMSTLAITVEGTDFFP